MTEMGHSKMTPKAIGAGVSVPLPDHHDNNVSLTSAYLDQFTEIVELIELLPDMPERIDDLLNWQPVSYQDYFRAAAMPGRVSATDVYASLNRAMRQNFEGTVDDLDRKALGAVAAIRRHYKAHGETRPDLMSEICARACRHLREGLNRAQDLMSQTPGSAANFAQRRKLRISET